MRDMTARMDFFMPLELARLVAEVARRHMLSKSDYARQALLEKLERDGVSPIRALHGESRPR
jgi:hypothetical protein